MQGGEPARGRECTPAPKQTTLSGSRLKADHVTACDRACPTVHEEKEDHSEASQKWNSPRMNSSHSRSEQQASGQTWDGMVNRFADEGGGSQRGHGRRVTAEEGSWDEGYEPVSVPASSQGDEGCGQSRQPTREKQVASQDSLGRGTAESNQGDEEKGSVLETDIGEGGESESSPVNTVAMHEQVGDIRSEDGLVGNSRSTANVSMGGAGDDSERDDSERHSEGDDNAGDDSEGDDSEGDDSEGHNEGHGDGGANDILGQAHGGDSRLVDKGDYRAVETHEDGVRLQHGDVSRVLAGVETAFAGESRPKLESDSVAVKGGHSSEFIQSPSLKDGSEWHNTGNQNTGGAIAIHELRIEEPSRVNSASEMVQWARPPGSEGCLSIDEPCASGRGQSCASGRGQSCASGRGQPCASGRGQPCASVQCVPVPPQLVTVVPMYLQTPGLEPTAPMASTIKKYMRWVSKDAVEETWSKSELHEVYQVCRMALQRLQQLLGYPCPKLSSTVACQLTRHPLEPPYARTWIQILQQVMQGSGVQGSGIQGSGVQGSGIQGSGVQGSGIQGSGVQGSGIQGSGVQGSRIQGSGIQCSGVQCGVLLKDGHNEVCLQAMERDLGRNSQWEELSRLYSRLLTMMFLPIKIPCSLSNPLPPCRLSELLSPETDPPEMMVSTGAECHPSIWTHHSSLSLTLPVSGITRSSVVTSFTGSNPVTIFAGGNPATAPPTTTPINTTSPPHTPTTPTHTTPLLTTPTPTLHLKGVSELHLHLVLQLVRWKTVEGVRRWLVWRYKRGIHRKYFTSAQLSKVYARLFHPLLQTLHHSLRSHQVQLGLSPQFTTEVVQSDRYVLIRMELCLLLLGHEHNLSHLYHAICLVRSSEQEESCVESSVNREYGVDREYTGVQYGGVKQGGVEQGGVEQGGVEQGADNPSGDNASGNNASGDNASRVKNTQRSNDGTNHLRKKAGKSKWKYHVADPKSKKRGVAEKPTYKQGIIQRKHSKLRHSRAKTSGEDKYASSPGKGRYYGAQLSMPMQSMQPAPCCRREEQESSISQYEQEASISQCEQESSISQYEQEVSGGAEYYSVEEYLSVGAQEDNVPY